MTEAQLYRLGHCRRSDKDAEQNECDRFSVHAILPFRLRWNDAPFHASKKISQPAGLASNSPGAAISGEIYSSGRRTRKGRLANFPHAGTQYRSRYVTWEGTVSANTAFIVAAASGIASFYLAAYVLARIPRDIREFKQLGDETRRAVRNSSMLKAKKRQVANLPS